LGRTFPRGGGQSARVEPWGSICTAETFSLTHTPHTTTHTQTPKVPSSTPRAHADARVPTLARDLSHAISLRGFGGCAHCPRSRSQKNLKNFHTPRLLCVALEPHPSHVNFSSPSRPPVLFSTSIRAERARDGAGRARARVAGRGSHFFHAAVCSLVASGGRIPRTRPTILRAHTRVSRTSERARKGAARGGRMWARGLAQKNGGSRIALLVFLCSLGVSLSGCVCRSGRLSAPYLTPRLRGRRSGVLRARLVRVGKLGGRARGTDGSASGRAGTSIFGVRVVVRGRQTERRQKHVNPHDYDRAPP
jgi:hypothetical protein